MRLLHTQNGFALTVVIIFTVLSLLIAGIYMAHSISEIKDAQHKVDETAALYLAEAGVQRALYEIIQRDENDTLPTSDLAINDYKINDAGGNAVNFLGANEIDILISPESGSDYFQVESTAIVRSSSKTVFAELRNHPPAGVLDYVYFINNWGWFYGNGISANGDVRSNGRFDFRNNPTVNGEAYAVNDVDCNDGEVRGMAGETRDGEYIYQHPGSNALPMPNLQDLSVYEEMALSGNASISVGGSVIVDGVYGDDAGESGNIVLVGTVQNPIEIHGPNVIRGDVIIKGIVTGQGTIYSGRNIYVTDNLNYKNGSGAAVPADQATDSWYQTVKDNDLIGYAARENIVFGDYTGNSGTWYSDEYLFNMGNEDVGVDGIPGTGDSLEGDGEFQEEYEDLDEDGVMDDNYTWGDVQTSVGIENFDYVPENVETFGDIATNMINSIDGIFYTNHAIAGKVGNVTIFGAVIGKDDAIVYKSTFALKYDYRIHSKFTGEDPNWLIALGLPHTEKWAIAEWQE